MTCLSFEKQIGDCDFGACSLEVRCSLYSTGFSPQPCCAAKWPLTRRTPRGTYESWRLPRLPMPPTIQELASHVISQSWPTW